MKDKDYFIEDVIYIEFFLYGVFIFSCQKSWFLDQFDIEAKICDLAIQYQVSPSSIQTKEISVKIPIPLPKDYMKNLVGDFGISYESED